MKLNQFCSKYNENSVSETRKLSNERILMLHVTFENNKCGVKCDTTEVYRLSGSFFS